MNTMVFETDNSPTLSIVKCSGDLTVRGSSRSTVRVACSDDKAEVKQEGATIMVSSASDLSIEAPYDTTCRIQKASADLSVKRILGNIDIESVHGDLVLNRVGAVRVGTAGADVSARSVDGDLIVGSIHGDFSAREIDGNLMVETVGRDLGLRDLHGNGTAQNVHGDIRLRTALLPGRSYSFKAGGDLVARIAADSHADLTLRSGRDKPRVKTELSNMTASQREVRGRLGDGGAEATMEAGRDLVLAIQDSEGSGSWEDMVMGVGSLGAEFGLEFAGLAEEIASQIDSQMSRMSSELEAKLSNLSSLDERAAIAAQRAQKQAEKAAEQLRRAADREAERARRRADKQRWKAGGRTSGWPIDPPESSSEPISDDERLAILNMVAEGKITIEEAESLLKALDA